MVWMSIFAFFDRANKSINAEHPLNYIVFLTKIVVYDVSKDAIGYFDAQAAKERDLAQATLLNLPGTKVSLNYLSRRLYIGNLYYDLKEEDICNAFVPTNLLRWIWDQTIWRYVAWPSNDDSNWCKWMDFITDLTSWVLKLANYTPIWINGHSCGSMKHISGNVNNLANWICTENVTFELEHRSNECRSQICIDPMSIFLIGVPDRSYSSLIADISLMEQSDYGRYTLR